MAKEVAVSRQPRDPRPLSDGFRFAALKHPEHAAVIARVLAGPTTRFDRAIVSYLTADEIDALWPHQTARAGSAAPTTPLITFAIQTGLRVAELTNLRCHDLHLVPARTCRPPERAGNTEQRR